MADIFTNMTAGNLTRVGKTQQAEQIQFYIELRFLFRDLLFIKRVQ